LSARPFIHASPVANLSRARIACESNGAVSKASPRRIPVGAQRNLDFSGLYQAKLDATNRTNALPLFSAAGTK